MKLLMIVLSTSSMHCLLLSYQSSFHSPASNLLIYISFTLFYFFFKEPTNFTATTNSIISISMNTSRLFASQYNSQYILLFRLKRKKIGPIGVEEQKNKLNLVLIYFIIKYLFEDLA